MSRLSEIFTAVRAAEGYGDKTQLISIITYGFGDKGGAKLDAQDADALLAFAVEELGGCVGVLEGLESYKRKDALLNYMERLLECVMISRPSGENVDPETRARIVEYGETVRRERFVEYAVGELFESGKVDRAGLERVLCTVTPLKDEYHRGMFFRGIAHYSEKLKGLDAESRELLARFTESEIERYCEMEITEDVLQGLEFAADVCRYYMDDTLEAALRKVFAIESSAINFYAVATLLECGKDVPADTVDALARDIEYAEMIHGVLSAYGRLDMFPSELCDEVYLAKSNMVHWLMYPTELGKAPDEIEYLGRVKKHFEVYHIFKFRSESDTLSDDLKGKWLIGWANDEGGTFSNFDEYSDYEKKTLSATLRYIKRKLL